MHLKQSVTFHHHVRSNILGKSTELKVQMAKFITLAFVAFVASSAFAREHIPGIYEQTTAANEPNFNDWMKCMGFKDNDREAISKVKATLEWSISGNIFTYRIRSSVAPYKVEFESGVEANNKPFYDGRKMTATFTVEGNKVTQDTKVGGFVGTDTFDFSSAGVKVTHGCGGKYAVRDYKRGATVGGTLGRTLG